MKWHILMVPATFLVTISLMLFNSCNKNDDEESSLKVEYDNPENWVSLVSVSKEVDVFYVYPTVSSSNTGAMDITNDGERDLVQGIFQSQASVFESSANIFAPYYRQMSTGVDMTGVTLATDTKEFKQGAVDVEDAFEYYIQNLNNNRPFIIAGHSQGSMALIELIKTRFGDDAELRARLVAAYLIGYTITDADLSAAGLTFAKNATDVGVVISYNTQSTEPTESPMLLPGAHCINPLNWRTDNQFADSTQNLGALFFNDETGAFIREVSNYCGAQINTENGALMTHIPAEDTETLEFGPFAQGVYHRYDYAFWYRNLQQNVQDRIDAYLAKK